MAAQQARLRKALAKLEPEIRRAFEKALQKATRAIDQRELLRLLDSGDTHGAAELLRIDQSYLWPLHEASRSTYTTGGQLAEDIATGGLRGVFAFNGRHPRAEQWITKHTGDLIEGIQREQIETTRKVILAGMQEGRSSLAVARDLTGRKVGASRVGGFMGLNSAQTDSIISGRAKLASGDPKLMREYLRLRLRDKRHDRAILKAIAEGKPITGAKLDRIMEAHRSKALGYRGRVIAKREARAAIAAGREEGMRQILDRPDVETITKTWQWNLSADPREHHQTLHGTTVDIDEKFDLGNGYLADHPHSEDLPASETIGCNCSAFYRIVFKRG